MVWICGEAGILSIGSVTIHLDRAEPAGDLLDRAAESRILRAALSDALDGVHHGGVVAAVEGARNFGKGELGELAGEVHRDLAGAGDGGGSAGGEELLGADL